MQADNNSQEGMASAQPDAEDVQRYPDYLAWAAAQSDVDRNTRLLRLYRAGLVSASAKPVTTVCKYQVHRNCFRLDQPMTSTVAAWQQVA